MLEKDPAGYWNERYRHGHTGWDIGRASPPLAAVIQQLTDKPIAILIPGAGNAYEAKLLLDLGFQDITIVDIAPILIQKLSQEFGNAPQLKLVCKNFFELEGKYDLILEQTFFCALLPSLRPKYAKKMHALLNDNGRLTGVLFDREFEGGPPFGGSRKEYIKRFSEYFNSLQFSPCHNSIEPRAGTELFFSCTK